MPLVAAAGDIGAEIFLCIALAALFACYMLTLFLRDHAPHWSIFGQGIDMRPWFDGPLRLIESWMHDIEATIYNVAEDAWLACQIAVAAVGWLLHYVDTHFVEKAIGEVTHELDMAKSALWDKANQLERVVGNATSGLVHDLNAVVHDVHYINGEFSRAWKEIGKLESAAFHGIAGIEKTIEGDVVSEIDKVLHGALSDINTLKTEVQHISAAIATIESALTPAILKDLPDLERLLKSLGRVGSIPGEITHIWDRIKALEGDIQGIPHLAEGELQGLRDLPHLLEWVKPLITVGAITGALSQAWRLMREGECPCPGAPTIKLPTIKFGGTEAELVALDMVVKDGV